jgi:hypothetical protein
MMNAVVDDSGSPSEKLSKVFIGQKTSGLNSRKLFAKFPSFDTGSIPKGEFQRVLTSLKTVETVVTWTEADISTLCEELKPEAAESAENAITVTITNTESAESCQEGGGADSPPACVSSQKMCDFCFSINHIGWKAEKNREKYVAGKTPFQNFGREEAVVEEPSGVTSGKEDATRLAVEASMEAADENPMSKMFVANPEFVGTTNKLFWKENMTVDGTFYSNGSVMSILPFNVSLHKDLPRIHLDEIRLREELEKKGLSSSSSSPTTPGIAGRGLELESFSADGALPTESELAEHLLQVEKKEALKEAFSHMEFVFGQIELQKSALVLKKRIADLVILDVPADYSAKVGVGMTPRSQDDTGAFQRMQESLEADANDAKRVRREAARKQRIVQMSLDALEAMRGDKKKALVGTKAQMRWWKAYESVQLQIVYQKMIVLNDGIDWTKYGYATVQ